MFLFWSALIVGGSWVRLGSWERWKGGKFGKVKKVGGWGSSEDFLHGPRDGKTLLTSSPSC